MKQLPFIQGAALCLVMLFSAYLSGAEGASLSQKEWVPTHKIDKVPESVIMAMAGLFKKDDLGAISKKGQDEYASGEYEKAVKTFTELTEKFPDFAEGYNNRGLSYHRLGDMKSAIKDYNKAIEVDPDFAQAYNNRGLAYRAIGDMAKAKADFEKASELQPGLGGS